MKMGSFFNYKLKRGLAGRRQSCQIVKSKFSKTDKVIWMHSASLGEYEQGLPVLDKLKEKFPNHKILVTFFSPSGYENVANKKTIADAVCYLPFDQKKWIDEFISNFETEIFFTVKYDFWYQLLIELKKRGVKTYVVSALFYETQVFFKPHGNWFLEQLRKNIDWFFHQTKHSTALAKSIGLVNSSTAGDTRFDRVKQILKRDNFVEHIQKFKQNEKLIVFGSSWESEDEIAKMIFAKNKAVKIIIAPHDLKRVEHLKTAFPSSVLYSEIVASQNRKDVEVQNQQPTTNNQRLLIIDCIGLLSKIYSYADLAVVGGGFHNKGLHNILEPATFGIPVFFGNQYKKNPEADELIAINGGKSFEDEFYAGNYLISLLKNPELIAEMSSNAGDFVVSQPNATEIIVRKILENCN